GRHGNCRSRCRCSARRRLARLKFFFQSLVQLRHLLVSLRLELFSQLPLDLTSLLEIARLELVSRVLIQTKTRLAQGRFSFVFQLLAVQIVAFAQQLLLLGIHAKPTLGIFPECLALLGRELKEALAWAPTLAWAPKLVVVPVKADTTSTRFLRRSLGEAEIPREDRERDRRTYKVESSSHRLFSSEANSSSKSATTS